MLQILKASAGSGKTFMLARKYIEILLCSRDRHAYRHILAVTFTNKATDEMKGRILKELHVLSKTPGKSKYHDHFVPSAFPSDADLQKKAEEVLSDILHDYSAFSVSTIDRFFQHTLKAFSREIGQFASYQVELDKDSLVAESVDRILDSLTEDDSALLAWLTDNILEQIEQGDRYSIDANLSEMAKRLKSVQRQEVMKNAGMNPDADYPKEKLMDIRTECRKIIADFRAEVRARASAVLDLLNQSGVKADDTNGKFLKALYKYEELSDNDVIVPPTPAFVKKALDSGKWFAAKNAHMLPLVHPFLVAPLEDFCDLFGREFKVYNTAVILDRQLYGLGVASELEKTFNELMKEKNVLCIDDSNTILRDIIDGSDAPFVYEKLGVRYENFLLDEFQDTANVQWDNFSPLLHESDSHGGENLIVGDVKQSIYRWRGSDWKLLNDTVPGQFPGHQVSVLDTNYRSLENVVNFNNVFFSTVSAVLDQQGGHQSGGPLSAIYADVVQKVRGRKADEKPGQKGSVSLTFCDRDKELDMVYSAVKEAVAAGAKYSEIAVLVRSNKTGENVSLALMEKGVPVLTDDSLHVKTSLTVRRLVSLMSYADNPEDTVSGFLAKSLDIKIPEDCSSLTDMVEALFRELAGNDPEGIWRGEALHIQSFMDHVQDYVSINGNNLRGFLKYWAGEDPSISSPSSGNSVRVITVHKAKGLDFQYVILPFAEDVLMYKAGKQWCVPDLAGSPLDGVAEGVYDVTLSEDSKNSLFSGDYEKERFLQQVDNINILYVAMTRARSGMHIISKLPSKECFEAIHDGGLYDFTDFSQILYWFSNLASMNREIPGYDGLVLPFAVKKTVLPKGESPEPVEQISDHGKKKGAGNGLKSEPVRFDVGEIVNFELEGEDDRDESSVFGISDYGELPSFPLNPETGGEGDVCLRGRLKFTADSLDFFSEEGAAGIAASNRIKGVVLHDILSRVEKPEDLESAVLQSLHNGDLTPLEADEARVLLSERLAAAAERGWFPETCDRILNESTLIDESGEMHRPDRVIITPDRQVLIIDYKFGDPRPAYARQLRTYAALWRRLGYESVFAWLWYVPTDEVVEVV